MFILRVKTKLCLTVAYISLTIQLERIYKVQNVFARITHVAMSRHVMHQAQALKKKKNLVTGALTTHAAYPLK